MGDIEGEADGGVDGGPHAASAHVGGGEAMDGHGDGEDGLVAGAEVEAVAAVVGEAELGCVGEEVARGGEESGGFRGSFEVVDGTAEAGERGQGFELKVIDKEWDIQCNRSGGAQGAGSADAEGDAAEGCPEVVEGVDD